MSSQALSKALTQSLSQILKVEGPRTKKMLTVVSESDPLSESDVCIPTVPSKNLLL